MVFLQRKEGKTQVSTLQPGPAFTTTKSFTETSFPAVKEGLTFTPSL
jgi:hypothetical protein